MTEMPVPPMAAILLPDALPLRLFVMMGIHVQWIIARREFAYSLPYPIASILAILWCVTMAMRVRQTDVIRSTAVPPLQLLVMI